MRMSVLSVKEVILMLVDRPNGSSFGFNGSVSFALESLRRITTVASFGFSKMTAGQPISGLSAALLYGGTWFTYCGEEKDWLVPGRLVGGEKVVFAVGGCVPRCREQLRHCSRGSSRGSPVRSSTLVARRWELLWLALLALLALLCTPLDVSLLLLVLL